MIIIYFLAFSNGVLNVFRKVFAVTFLIGICYVMFGNILKEKGYDPVDKLIETAQFAMDVENPDWDKGRSIPREYALSIWNRNLYTGVGYTSLQNYGLPENISSAHNFVITSLFHRGIIGTSIYLLILILLFKNAISLWSLANRKKSYESDVIKILIVSSFFWFIPFWTQEIIWEKYSMSIQFLYLGLISNVYKQLKLNFYRARPNIISANFNL
ncbi:MAG: hypothetical protein EOO43_22780 [Flavobacterium sp.]|nr:MAG: hypothetical protein EOO43_22780 [Flavobacterium sp.]